MSVCQAAAAERWTDSNRPVLVLSAVFLRSHKSLESVDPQFTMRRKMEQLREELELLEQLRDVRLARCLVRTPSDTHTTVTHPAIYWVTRVVSSSEHREQAEDWASRGPRLVSDGRRRPLPFGQSHSPTLCGQHPRPLACGGTCQIPDAPETPWKLSVSYWTFKEIVLFVWLCASSPNWAWPSVGEMWRTSWTRAEGSAFHR